MKCLPVPRVPESAEWIYEIKLGGYRLEIVRSRNLVEFRVRWEHGKTGGLQRPQTVSADCFEVDGAAHHRCQCPILGFAVRKVELGAAEITDAQSEPETKQMQESEDLTGELPRTIKRSVDSDRRAGRFLLTGSTNILTWPHFSESLAGRMEIVT